MTAYERPAESAIRVLIVDDDEFMRAGIAAILSEDTGIAVVGQADDGVSAIVLAQDLRPDVVVMDIAMPLIDGVEATRLITERLPDVKVLSLSTHTHIARIRDIMDAGALGYVVKKSARRDLAAAVHSVADGAVFLSAGISAQFLRSVSDDTAEN